MISVCRIGIESCAQEGDLSISQNNNHVVEWIRYKRVYRTFTMETAVVAATFAKYSKCIEKEDKWVVIACEDMSIHSYNLRTGESFILGLMFRPETMHPCGNIGVAFSYHQRANEYLDLALMEGPELLPRSIVPSSLCSPLRPFEQLKLITEKYMVIWNHAELRVIVYSINLVPEPKITNIGIDAANVSGINSFGSTATATMRGNSSDAADHLQTMPFYNFNGTMGKGAVYSPLCEWLQESCGITFSQNWDLMESIVVHDYMAMKFYIYDGNDVFAFKGAAFISPIKGVFGFPAIAVISDTGNVHIGFFCSPDAECTAVDVEAVDITNIKQLKTEPENNCCEIVLQKPQNGVSSIDFIFDLEFDDLVKKCFEIIVDIQGPQLAVRYLPEIFMRFADANRYQTGGMLAFMEHFIFSVSPEMQASQLLVYLHMLCEELKILITGRNSYRILKVFLAPFVQQWGDQWSEVYPLAKVEQPHTNKKIKRGIDSKLNETVASDGKLGDFNKTEPVNYNVRPLPIIIDSPPNIFAAIADSIAMNTENHAAIRASNTGPFLSLGSAIIEIFKALSTDNSNEIIEDMIENVLPYVDRLVPGLRTCILEICNFFHIDYLSCAADNIKKSSAPRTTSLAYAIFDKDLRYKECQRQLQVNKPQKCLLGVYIEGKSAVLSKEALENWSYKLASRALACGYGRSAVELNSRRPMLWEQMEPVEINFEGECTETGVNVPPYYNSLANAASEDPWGVFSHGVSLGLSIIPNSPGIDSLWVVSSNKLRNESRELYSGFVYGMGLSGHLSTLEDWQFYESLVNTNTSGTIAALLGVAASKKGSRDIKLTKVLTVHIRALLPEGGSYNSTLVPPEVERAALISLGLLYYGQGDRHLSDMLLRQLCLVNESVIGQKFLKSEASLNLDISSGVRNKLRSVDTIADGEGTEHDFSHKLAVGITLGLINNGKPESKNLEPLLENINMNFDRNVDATEVENGALLAIMLTYAGCNDISIAQKIKIPHTMNALRYSTPSIIFLKALTYHLIMWDEIRIDKKWVEAQIPNILQEIVTNKKSSYIAKLYYYYELAGVLIALAMRYCGTGNEDAIDLLIHYTTEVFQKKYDDTLVILGKLRSGGEQLIDYPLLYTVQNLAKLLSSLALSVAAVASGTGNLKVLRLLREFNQIGPQVQAWFDNDMNYSPEADFSLPQISQAIGWLFLAEGTCSFKANPQSASLLACFSFLPLSAGPGIQIKEWEHLYFFWALVTEKRCLFVKDAPTTKVKVEVCLKDGQVINCITPSHMPPLSLLDHINIVDDNYMSECITDCENVIAGEKPGIKPIVRKSVGGSLRSILEREHDKNQQLSMNARQDAWVTVQMKMLKATLYSMVRKPSDSMQEWDIEVLLTFYEHWPQMYDDQILTREEAEELRLLRWLRNNPSVLKE